MAFNLFKNVNPYFYEGENPTVDLIIVNPMDEVLLIKRSSKSAACPGMFAFPGGFVDSSALEGNFWMDGLETPRLAALRELHEETNLVLDKNVELKFVGEFVGNNQDPRDNVMSWSKSHVFYYQIDEKTYESQKKFIRGMDDAEQAKWVPLKEARLMKLAFDHNKILEKIR